MVKDKIPANDFFKYVNNEENLANKNCFPLSVGGHKFGLMIWPLSLEIIMLIAETCFSLKDWTKEEKQTLKLISH